MAILRGARSQRGGSHPQRPHDTPRGHVPHVTAATRSTDAGGVALALGAASPLCHVPRRRRRLHGGDAVDGVGGVLPPPPYSPPGRRRQRLTPRLETRAATDGVSVARHSSASARIPPSRPPARDTASTACRCGGSPTPTAAHSPPAGLSQIGLGEWPQLAVGARARPRHVPRRRQRRHGGDAVDGVGGVTPPPPHFAVWRASAPHPALRDVRSDRRRVGRAAQQCVHTDRRGFCHRASFGTFK